MRPASRASPGRGGAGATHPAPPAGRGPGAVGDPLDEQAVEVVEDRLELLAVRVGHAAPHELLARRLEVADAHDLGLHAEALEQVAQEVHLGAEAERRDAARL